MRKGFGAVLPLVMMLGSAALAQEGQTVLYGGFGPASEEDDEVDAMPWVVGLMRQSAGSRLVLGFDMAGEGTMLDSTWGGDELRQALSFNLLVGGAIADTGTVRVDAGALLGLRESFADCPDSYLGYQCYADRAPDTEYEVNYGAMVALSFDRTMVGLRVTGESVQGLVGFRF